MSVDGASERAVQPDLLDDGQHLVFSVPSPAAMNRPTESGEGPIVVQAIGGTDRRVLVPMGLHPRVLPTGHLTYVHNGTLFAVAFDAGTRTVSGDTMPLVEGIPQSGVSAVAQFAVSQNGSLIYGQGVPTATSFQLVSVDRSGFDRPLPCQPSRYQQPRLSPDKRRLVVSAGGQISIWTFATETLMRVTTNDDAGALQPGVDGQQPCGVRRRRHRRGGGRRIVRRSADGAGTEEVIVPAPAGYPDAVAPDGRFLIFHPAARVAMLVPLQPRGEARPLLPDLKGQSFGRRVFAGWTVDCLRVERIGRVRGLRAPVPGRQRTTLSDLVERRSASALVAGWARTVLHRGRRHDDGGSDCAAADLQP